jgi:5-methylcytosine-specific restriction endonuclease McrA
MLLFISDFLKHIYLKYTHKRINYDKYLQSKHWKKVRAKAIKRADYRCAFCSSRIDLVVHHNRYYSDNHTNILYWEKPTDLVCLCSKCHTIHHKYIYKTIKEVS